MNRRGQLWVVLFIIGILVMLTAFATIEPLKDNFNGVRKSASGGLNCPGTSDYDSAAFANQSYIAKLTYRPTCFITGIGIVWFIGAIFFAVCTWLYTNWQRSKNK